MLDLEDNPLFEPSETSLWRRIHALCQHPSLPLVLCCVPTSLPPSLARSLPPSPSLPHPPTQSKKTIVPIYKWQLTFINSFKYSHINTRFKCDHHTMTQQLLHSFIHPHNFTYSLTHLISHTSDSYIRPITNFQRDSSRWLIDWLNYSHIKSAIYRARLRFVLSKWFFFLFGGDFADKELYSQWWYL